MRTQADRDDDLAIGRELERKDAEIDRLRAALKPFADEVTVTADGRFSAPTDRRRSNVADLIRARRVYDANQQSVGDK